MNKDKTNPSFQIKSRRASSSRYSRTPHKSKSAIKTGHSRIKSSYKQPALEAQLSISKQQLNSEYDEIEEFDTVNHELKFPVFNKNSASQDDFKSSAGKKIRSPKKKPAISNPLDLGFDANKELIRCYQEHIALQEDTIAKLSGRIDKLEEVHGGSNSNQAPELLEVRAEAEELRAALTRAEAAIHAERRLVAALHADNTKIKLELLQMTQRCVSLQVVSGGVSEARLVSLQGSQLVRQQMPDQLRRLQQKLWAAADSDIAAGAPVSAETVLSLQQRVRSLEESQSCCERQWAEERAVLLDDQDLRDQERELDQARLEAWVRRVDQRLSECQRECRASAAHCCQLTAELQRQEKQHLQERAALLGALAKLGGPERLRRELESLDLSSSCLTAAAGHASDTCQARETKLLNLQLQRELSECQELLQQSQERSAGLQREACLLRQGREEALAVIKKQRSSASDQQSMWEAREERVQKQLRAELQGAQADLTALHQDLKRLVHMMYKLTMWQSDMTSPDAPPPSPPAWVEGPRAVTALARKLQAAMEASRMKLAGVRRQVVRAAAS